MGLPKRRLELKRWCEQPLPTTLLLDCTFLLFSITGFLLGNSLWKKNAGLAVDLLNYMLGIIKLDLGRGVENNRFLWPDSVWEFVNTDG